MNLTDRQKSILLVLISFGREELADIRSAGIDYLKAALSDPEDQDFAINTLRSIKESEVDDLVRCIRRSRSKG
jgi:hypothetical protein